MKPQKPTGTYVNWDASHLMNGKDFSHVGEGK